MVIGHAIIAGAGLPLRVRAPVLVATNPHSVRRLLNLPGPDANPSAHFGQGKVQRLLEGVPAVLAGEVEELSHPTHKTRLMLRKRQLLIPQEVGVSVQHRSHSLAWLGHNWTSVLYANYHITNMAMPW